MDDDDVFECFECGEELPLNRQSEHDADYCDGCLSECARCGDHYPESEFHDLNTCKGCYETHFCDGCEEMVDEWVNRYKLCNDCDLKQNPHENYTALMASIEGLAERLRDRKVVLVTGSCCGSCSASEGGATAEREGLLGYAYYHEQDEDSLREGGDNLYIGYGGDSEEAALMVKNIVVQTLKDIGALVCATSPGTNSRIEVAIVDEPTEHGLIELGKVAQ